MIHNKIQYTKCVNNKTLKRGLLQRNCGLIGMSIETINFTGKQIDFSK